MACKKPISMSLVLVLTEVNGPATGPKPGTLSSVVAPYSIVEHQTHVGATSAQTALPHWRPGRDHGHGNRLELGPGMAQCLQRTLTVLSVERNFRQIENAWIHGPWKLCRGELKVIALFCRADTSSMLVRGEKPSRHFCPKCFPE